MVEEDKLAAPVHVTGCGAGTVMSALAGELDLFEQLRFTVIRGVN
jgi:hypothetical protein